MSTRAIKATHGNQIEISDECGSPLSIRFEDDDGKFHRVSINLNDASEIAAALDAFVVIHKPR